MKLCTEAQSCPEKKCPHRLPHGSMAICEERGCYNASDAKCQEVGAEA